MPIRSITCFFILFSLCTVSAKDLGPDVSVYRGEELKWGGGSYGYFVMFKSLLELDTESSNIMCKDEAVGSTYVLDPTHTPTDALIERAFLVWSGTVPIVDKGDITDNEVTLSFVSEDGRISENQVIKGKKAYKVSEAEGFEFDAFTATDDSTHSYFTYRVDITDFFKSIHDKGRELGNEYDGYSLYGNYTMKDLKCAKDESYLDLTTLVAGWSIIMIYTSKEISPKKIYLYDGFKPYWHEENELHITGFEFPTDPEIRITLATLEGDPNLVSVYENDAVTLATPEGLKVQGDQVGWLLLSNECNPEAEKTEEDQTLKYVEIFNSISSVYGWMDSEPTCIGGIPPDVYPENIEYSMDVDTLVMDSEIVGEYAAHFNKGGMQIGLRIGANQDSIITNFMIVSVDTKHPTFDIPDQPELVACTPANIPVDPKDPDSKWCDNGLLHTFAIRIQNWGDNLSENATVKVELPFGLEYIPGTTAIATMFKNIDNKKIAINWLGISDEIGGAFPLQNNYKIAELIDYCYPNDFLSCENTILVRFSVIINKGIKPPHVFEIMSFINDSSEKEYKTNLGIPLKLKPASAEECVINQMEIDLSDCGSNWGPDYECYSNEDCVEDFCCNLESHSCEFCYEDKICNQDYSVNVGKNSPSNDVVFIPARENIVLGQIAILSSEFQDCFYNFQKLAVKMDIDDKNIEITNPRLYFDRNGNGAVDYIDSQEMPFAYGSFDENSSRFEFFSSTQNFNAEYLNYIIIVADISYKEGEIISKTATFTPSIETGGITIVDDGEPEITGLPVSFSKFQLEPDNAFIITKGEKDSLLTGNLYHEYSNYADLLQFRAVSNGGNETLKSISVKLINDDETVEFGHELGLLSIFYDENNDGSGNELIIKAEKADSGRSHKFNVDIPFEDGISKYFTIKAGIDLDDGDHFQIQISDIEIESDKETFGLPVNSKEYTYTCDPTHEDCSKPCCSPYPCSLLFI